MAGAVFILGANHVGRLASRRFIRAGGAGWGGPKMPADQVIAPQIATAKVKRSTINDIANQLQRKSDFWADLH
ncbi:hypothetical protein [Sphingobium lignivorans]|uniref:Uncharacterized protein n=1 Tax=Sphingobium lignivorans TaxID=2735886 RepID=A0ABR6N9W2_9SPHN|nr:hypothetical protein [Sphingobium lignivorans]MBB5984059.1 hypothetical protein [Sphingobium lignivorans]